MVSERCCQVDETVDFRFGRATGSGRTPGGDRSPGSSCFRLVPCPRTPSLWSVRMLAADGSIPRSVSCPRSTRTTNARPGLLRWSRTRSRLSSTSYGRAMTRFSEPVGAGRVGTGRPRSSWRFLHAAAPARTCPEECPDRIRHSGDPTRPASRQPDARTSGDGFRSIHPPSAGDCASTRLRHGQRHTRRRDRAECAVSRGDPPRTDCSCQPQVQASQTMGSRSHDT